MKKNQFVPGAVREDAAETVVAERRFHSWLDEVFNNHKREGGLEDNPYMGKPIEITGGDPLNSMLKNANYLPEWLELQHKIRDEIIALHQKAGTLSDEQFEQEAGRINAKIGKYNRSVPSPHLQKYPVFRENLAKQLDKWE